MESSICSRSSAASMPRNMPSTRPSPRLISGLGLAGNSGAVASSTMLTLLVVMPAVTLTSLSRCKRLSYTCRLVSSSRCSRFMSTLRSCTLITSLRVLATLALSSSSCCLAASNCPLIELRMVSSSALMPAASSAICALACTMVGKSGL
ncbi:hypothetical protein Y695_03347 [Hydrogenophaga sp. T4]|nr:hypothetical protein Y695_03347 [Hydrogenophaga sp. T4]